MYLVRIWPTVRIVFLMILGVFSHLLTLRKGIQALQLDVLQRKSVH